MIRFCVNGQWIEESAVASDMTVLRYLRTRQALVGTKEGCGSGDCGACSVLLGEYVSDLAMDAQQGQWRYKAINSCITFISQLDGKSLITIEALANTTATSRQLHPAQQAMIDYHGSQCGFCTPGIVMSLAALHEHQQCHSDSEPLTQHQIIDALSGNLCRCTGYRPIIEAAVNMNQYHNNSGDEGVVGIWQPQLSSATEEREAGLLTTEVATVTADTLDSESISQSWSPRSEDELVALLAKYPSARIVAGATDIALEVTQMNRRISQLIAINNIASLQTIAVEDDFIFIGAGVTYSQMEPSLCEHFPEFGQLLQRFASRQVRNQGTMAGNIANASPIGDTPPVLLALAASIELVSADGSRWLPLSEFFLAYKKTSQRAGEYIRRIKIPRLHSQQVLKVYKISKRLEDDISAVLVALKFTLEKKSNKYMVRALSSGFGGMAGIPKSAPHLEQTLLGRDLSIEKFEQAAQALDQDFTPMTDVRASSDYRMQVAKNIIIKSAFELSNPNTITRIESLDERDLTAAQVGVHHA